MKGTACEPKSAVANDFEQVYDRINQIWAMIPVYDSGDSTLIIYDNGERCVVTRIVRNILRDMAERKEKEQINVRNCYGEKRTASEPLILGPNIVFALLKCRNPIGKDSAYGYINMAISNTEYELSSISKSSCHLCRDEQEEPILILHSSNMVEKKLRTARKHHINFLRRLTEEIQLVNNPHIIKELIQRLQRNSNLW